MQLNAPRWGLLLAACAALAACGGGDDDAPAAPPPSAGGAAGSGGASAPSPPRADLRADVNRDGVVSLDGPGDDDGEATWDAQRGAIFLANLDDDLGACPIVDAAARPLSDDDLARCNDAADEIVNGPDDELDLAPLRVAPWPDAGDDAEGVISVSAGEKVRVFKRTTSGFQLVRAAEDKLSAAELRAGIELGLEGRDIVRDAAQWDGTVDVTLTVTAGGASATDSVRLRVAPLLFFHHLMPAEQIFATKVAASGSKAFRADLAAATEGTAITALDELEVDDQWTQDFFETAFMSAPGVGGPRVMQVFVRSANVYEPKSASFPLREAGRVVFERFRGKDRAGVVQYERGHDEDSDTLNSFGNLEVVPPTPGHPLGRILRGSVPSFAPDPSFATMIASQRMQPPILVDTSWLEVAHVDETLSFVRAKTPLGWALAVNDARLAKSILEGLKQGGHGDAAMFEGKKWYTDDGDQVPAVATVAQVLDDTAVMSASAKAAVEVDAQLEILKKETGVTDDAIIRVPFLHHEVYAGASAAYQPGMVNGIYLADGVFAAPDPHGPIVDGVDPFKAATEAAFAARGVEVRWVEDWDLYHRNLGEVHCGSNTRRRVSVADARWWEMAK
ncbi:MAG: protein-arginine deiminase [Polyangiaceae bacterium]|nr:protein-arginine deiminase [Polyangiaceae bacterium]